MSRARTALAGLRLSALLACGGCATVTVQVMHAVKIPNSARRGYYAGIRHDVDTLGEWRGPWGYLVFSLALLDLPLSFAADTVLLPFQGGIRLLEHLQEMRRAPDRPPA